MDAKMIRGLAIEYAVSCLDAMEDNKSLADIIERALTACASTAAADEREACALVVEDKGAEHRKIADDLRRDGSSWAATAHKQFADVLSGNADSAAMRIRARGTR